jgi:CBS domain containing-hemolysin-like protein
VEAIIIISSLLFSAIFSGLEIAFITSSKLQIELEAQKGSLAAKICSKFVSHPSRFIATLLIGNNAALVVFTIYMEAVLGQPLSVLGNPMLILLIQTIISTIVILFLAEYLPKSLFQLSPNSALRFFAYPINLVYYLLYFFVSGVIGVSKKLLKWSFNVDLEEEKPVFGKIDLNQYLEDFTSQVDEEEEVDHEIQIFQNALDFSSIKVRECMVPRTEIVALSIDDTVEKLSKKFTKTGYSKILIYRENIDNIIGLVDSFEMFKRPEEIKQILLPIMIVPESMPADELLSTFKKKRKTVAVVVDEFGGTAGMVTIEDVIEEIFGEIEDEHDAPDLVEVKINENEFLFASRLEVDYLNEEHKLQLPESEEYETLGGLIIHHYQSIPKGGTYFNLDRYSFLIEKVSDTKIELVRLFVKEIES